MLNDSGHIAHKMLRKSRFGGQIVEIDSHVRFYVWRVEFGLCARKVPQLATVELADGAANEPAALVALRSLVRPDCMTVIELVDGRRVFAPAGSSPAEVKQQFAKRQK